MDPKRFKRKYFLAVLISPITLLPFVGGVICSMSSLVIESASLGLVGAVGILVGVGTFVYRSLVSPSEKIARKAQEEIEREDNEAREAALDELQEQFSKMRDSHDSCGSRAYNLLSSLRELYAEFSGTEEWKRAADRFSVSETLSKVKSIFQYSVTSLEKIIELRDKGRATRITEVRRKYEERIKQILSDLEKGVEILKKTLAGYHEIAASQDISDNTTYISKLGEELDKHLRIAADVSKMYAEPPSEGSSEEEKGVQ